MRVLDLGGDPRQWEHREPLPRSITALNLDQKGHSTDLVEYVLGDACSPPAEITSRQFDLVFSNSVLEHVGGHARRHQFAETVRRLAPHHWVQTPYRYFPIEPHWVLPGMQFLPLRLRVAVAQHRPYGPGNRDVDRERAIAEVAEVELVGITEMQSYFPESEIWRERFGGLVKSLVAVR